MELVALLSTGKGTWAQVAGVINHGEWDKVILIGNDFAKKFKTDQASEFIEYKTSRLTELKEELSKKLKGKIKGTEVALSIASGSGKEHMALISALLSLPVGIRFTALTKQGLVSL
jgi:prefoldin subunit 5